MNEEQELELRQAVSLLWQRVPDLIERVKHAESVPGEAEAVLAWCESHAAFVSFPDPDAGLLCKINVAGMPVGSPTLIEAIRAWCQIMGEPVPDGLAERSPEVSP